MVKVRYTGVDKAAFLAEFTSIRRRIIAHGQRVGPASTDARMLDAGKQAIETLIFHFCGYVDFAQIRPEPRVAAAPSVNLGPHPPDPTAALARWRAVPDARLELKCGACTWSRRYDIDRLIRRLTETGRGDANSSAETVAAHVQWPCPACRRMRWGARIVVAP